MGWFLCLNGPRMAKGGPKRFWLIVAGVILVAVAIYLITGYYHLKDSR